MSKCLDWGVLLILVGEGQDIYQKEIGSLQIWADTLSPDWEVACPSKLLPVFKRAKFVEDKLNLTVSLRTHTAGQYSKFVNMMIAGYTKEAKDLLGQIGEDFPIYLTMDLSAAQQYCINRYHEEDHKDYGMITSSKEAYPWYPKISKWEWGPWYVLPRGEKGSSGNFEKVATEFSCQGLELDMPIVCWKDDVLWDGQKW